jgi:hypothetical protein
MRTSIIGLWIAGLAAAAAAPAWGQTPPPSGKTLAATMNVYAFPNAGQTAEQQSQDESACYQWAVQNTGADPFELSKQAEQQKQQAAANQQAAAQAGQGARARGAVAGAATGALIGEIADDDAGKGAAYGAAAGAMAGGHRKRQGPKAGRLPGAAQDQQAQAAMAGQMDNFKKAFSACMESKKYMVKY